jgi:imidazolonepropionase-like amidohydrolase
MIIMNYSAESRGRMAVAGLVWLLSVSIVLCVAPAGAAAAGLDPADSLQPILNDLGVTLRVRERPSWPKPVGDSVSVTLSPQVDAAGKSVVSFGLPFGPDVLTSADLIRVADAEGREIAAYAKPLGYWGIDGKQGSIRAVLIQFEAAFNDRSPSKVIVTWNRPRTAKRMEATPVADTEFIQQNDGFEFHCPKVLAVLPADWLCASLIAWQQVPASQNKVAEWFDQHLVQQFPGSVQYIASKRYESHLYDRPATYAKIYVRYGEEKYLLAALQANDFYVQHLGDDGFFDLKPGDFKYVYAEGSTIMYLLTGDERYRHAVERGLLSWAKWPRVAYKGSGFWTERHAGTGMAAHLHAYEILGDPKLLDIARRYFEGVLAMQVKPLDGKPPNGAWVHTAESHGDGNGWTTSPWMSALLMDSIWKLWMLTGDARCPASLALYSKFLEKHALTPDGKRVYYMANSPERGRSVNPESSAHNVEAAYILAMGYYLSAGADAGLLQKIQTVWPAIVNDNANSPSRKFSWRFRETSMLVWFLANTQPAAAAATSLKEVNPPPVPDPGHTVAIVGAQLIDGRGGPPVPDATVVVRGERIVGAGPRSSVPVPEGAEVIDGKGCSLVPGLIDAHFHIERNYQLPRLFMAHGVTSVRDPGQWLRIYEPIRQSELPQPRCFVAGPHLDCAPHAYPQDAFTVTNAEETRGAVNRFVDEGSSVIKVYFRLPLDLIEVACKAAHERGVPVTAHLELVDADQAIRAGIDGVEHVTSFGTALAAPSDAEQFRAEVTRDNNARRSGRYALWSKIDLDHSPRVQPLLELLAARKTVVSPTLAVFEMRRGDRGADDEKVRGFENMLKFVGMCHRAGITLVVGSHSQVPKAELGGAYQREMELLAECGLSPMEVLSAATVNNARFFRIQDRLGSLEPGKLADLVLIDGDPLKDIKVMRQVKRVMLNGRWVAPAGPEK